MQSPDFRLPIAHAKFPYSPTEQSKDCECQDQHQYFPMKLFRGTIHQLDGLPTLKFSKRIKRGLEQAVAYVYGEDKLTS